MADINEKLKFFSDTVISSAEEKRKELEDEMQKIQKETLEQIETQCLEKAYQRIQKAIFKYSSEANKLVLNKQFELKTGLIKYREEISVEIFSEVNNKIREYTKTDKYKNWLVEKSISVINELGEGKKVLYINSSDEQYKELLEKTLTDVDVLFLESEDILGGVRGYNKSKNIMIDETLIAVVDAQKNNFIAISSLKVN